VFSPDLSLPYLAPIPGWKLTYAQMMILLEERQLTKMSLKGIYDQNVSIKKSATFSSTFLTSSRLSYPFTGCAPAEPASVSLNTLNLT